MSEVDELSIISFMVSVPFDVMVTSGDENDTLNVIVNDSSVSVCVVSDTLNTSFTISYRTEDAVKDGLRMTFV